MLGKLYHEATSPVLSVDLYSEKIHTHTMLTPLLKIKDVIDENPNTFLVRHISLSNCGYFAVENIF